MTTQTPVKKPKTKKLLLQVTLGAVVGAAGMIAALTALESQPGFLDDGARVFALATALVFLLTGAVVSLGVASPSVGARTLNVEDANEIKEQRTVLLVGSITFLLIATFLGAIALADGNDGIGPLPTVTATILAAVSGTGLVVIGLRYRKFGDEMMRQLSHDANGIMVALIFLTAVVKSAAAQLNYAAPIAPLEIIAGFFAIYLLSVFIAVGRRGLLTPR